MSQVLSPSFTVHSFVYRVTESILSLYTDPSLRQSSPSSDVVTKSAHNIVDETSLNSDTMFKPPLLINNLTPCKYKQKPYLLYLPGTAQCAYPPTPYLLSPPDPSPLRHVPRLPLIACNPHFYDSYPSPALHICYVNPLNPSGRFTSRYSNLHIPQQPDFSPGSPGWGSQKLNFKGLN